MGDFLKDLKHYEHASPFPGLGLYRSSKYLERFCDAMIWIANKLEIERFPPDVISKFNAIKIDGKTPAQVKGGLGGLVAIRGGKKDFSGVEGVADQQQEKEAYSTEQVKQLFPSVNTLRDLGDIVKTAGREVNAVLRAAEAGQRMIAKNEQAYFPKKG